MAEVKVAHLVASGQALTALRHLSDPALQTQLGMGQVWHLRGQAYGELGQYREALAAWACTVEHLGETAERHVQQAVCWLHLDQPMKALHHCDLALQLDPHHDRAALFRGVALQRLGRYDAAYGAYHQALGAAPCRRVPAPLRAVLAQYRGKTEGLVHRMMARNPKLKAWLKRQGRKLLQGSGRAVLH